MAIARLVHSVPTVGSHQAAVSVTEVSIPANWALSTIIIESNSSNTNHYLPVINPPNASARILNDIGVVFTFTNTCTPPPPPGPVCTLTQGFWKNHEERWDDAADGKPFLVTSTFYNSGAGYLTIMNTPPKGGSAYLQLAHQFIAASLNVNGGLLRRVGCGCSPRWCGGVFRRRSGRHSESRQSRSRSAAGVGDDAGRLQQRQIGAGSLPRLSIRLLRLD